MKSAIKQVNEVLEDSTFEYIIAKMINAAECGEVQCRHSLRTINPCCRDLLTEQLIKLLQPLLRENYAILIADEGNEEKSKVCVYIRWDGDIPNRFGNKYIKNELLYSSNM